MAVFLSKALGLNGAGF